MPRKTQRHRVKREEFAGESQQDAIRSEEIQVKLDVMPGFRFSWWYSGAEFEPETQSAYRNYDLNKEFVR